ncbi:hypothetical protein GCM10009801_72600 [Streptomyces albiaxialis]|uniref:SH3b domain-containing protein n=1 Tax=Streptomyces albiaxialis TaxID=329523 RepID=A0ABN2WWN9_9ACTN
MAQVKSALRKAGLAAAGVTAALGMAFTLAPGASAAAPHQASARVDAVCTVNDNGVNYRGGPGPEYRVLGQVNRGQKMNLKGHQGNWVHGDLWGGRTGVWIHTAYLDGC